MGRGLENGFLGRGRIFGGFVPAVFSSFCVPSDKVSIGSDDSACMVTVCSIAFFFQDFGKGCG